MKSPESYEKVDICKFLDSLQGCWYFKPYMAGYGKSGVPDIVGCYEGKFFSVEVKREGAKPTPQQLRRFEEINFVAGGWSSWGTSAKVIPELKRFFGIADHAAILEQKRFFGV